ncbi:hypothetical protein T492DRAFT_976914 [Pavlovales sp. CCMP2436]|nr:hypothetical protein T492DRAFT_976914 [Pavlovales sp. CCMP2436]
MICWLLFVVFPRWAAIGASALKRASNSCAWPRAAIVPIVSMSCFLMRAGASIGLTPISAYILRPPCAAISLTSEDSSWRLTVLNVLLV